MLSQYSEGDKSSGVVNIGELSPRGLISISQAPLPGYLHPEWPSGSWGGGASGREVTDAVTHAHADAYAYA